MNGKHKGHLFKEIFRQINLKNKYFYLTKWQGANLNYIICRVLLEYISESSIVEKSTAGLLVGISQYNFIILGKI